MLFLAEIGINLYNFAYMATTTRKELIISDMLTEMDFGMNHGEVLASVGAKWHLPRRTFDRYWSDAKDRFNSALASREAVFEAIKVEAKIEVLKSKIMAKNERMEVLSQIARSELKLKKEVITADGIQVLNVKPDYTDRKAAIAELNKMDGEYAPIRKETKHSGDLTIKPDLSHLSTEELMKRAALIREING